MQNKIEINQETLSIIRKAMPDIIASQIMGKTSSYIEKWHYNNNQYVVFSKEICEWIESKDPTLWVAVNSSEIHHVHVYQMEPILETEFLLVWAEHQIKK